MEKENKNIRDKHLKKEKARLIKLVDLAYKLDPRIVNAKQQEEVEKQKKKQEVRDRKANKRKELEDQIAAVEALKVKEVEVKKADDSAAKEEKAKMLKMRRELVKSFSNLCEEKLVGSKYDRWFVEEFVKKIPGVEPIQEIANRLRVLSGDNMI
jgi:hypothetical protein